MQQHARVEVVEPPLADRVRRPSDVLRFFAALAVLAVVLLLGTLAHGTATGVETDVAEAVALVPSIVLFLLNLVTGVGFLALPIAVSLDLLIRHRGRQLLDAMTGTVLAALTVITLNATIVHVDSLRQLHFALSVGLPGGKLSAPFSILLASAVAFLVVARVSERRGLLPLSILVISASVATSLARRADHPAVHRCQPAPRPGGRTRVAGHPRDRAEPAYRARHRGGTARPACPASCAWSAPTAAAGTVAGIGGSSPTDAASTSSSWTATWRDRAWVTGSGDSCSCGDRRPDAPSSRSSARWSATP